MRTTVDLDDNLLKKAASFTGIKQKTALLEEGLRALLRRAAAQRLIALGGTDPKASGASRRRF